jgi:hypothetical protein
MPSVDARPLPARWCLAVVLLTVACHGNDETQCSCPADVGVAMITLSCVPATPPLATVNEDCTVALTAPDLIEVTSDVAGTCHVDVTFANGTTSATDITMTAQTFACGSNPHACGNFAATPAAVTIAAPCADSGVDAAPSD